MSNPTISSETTEPGFVNYRVGTTAKMRIYSNQSLRTASPDNQFVPIGFVGNLNSAFVTLDLPVQSDKSLAIPATSKIPFTTNSTEPTGTFTAVIYDSKNANKIIFLQNFTVPEYLGSTFTWTDLQRVAAGNSLTNPPTVFPSFKQMYDAIADRISGAGAPKMTNVINGIGKLYEAAINSIAPIIAGINSIFINSTRTSAAASLTGHVEGTTAKLTDGNQGQVYDNNTTYSLGNLGVYSITDFDANDNFSSDCTQKIQDAFDAIDVAGGGTVRFIASAKGQGKFVITDKLVWPSTGKLILEGDGSAIGGRVQLVLTGNNKSAIQVGQNLIDVTIRNLSFKTSGTGNKAILFTGSGSNATQIITVRDCTFDGFAQPVAVLATDIPKAWQCSYSLIENCTFHNFSDKGFYIDALNSDWDIRNCKFFGAVNAYGIYAAGCASLHIGACDFLGPAGAGAVCTLGVPNPLFSDTAIYLNGARGVITIDHKCQLENFRRTLVVNYADQTYPIEFNGNLMPATIELNDDCTFNYSGNLLYANTIQIPNGVDVRLCATGINFVSQVDTCLSPLTGGGAVVGTGSYIVFRPTINGTEFRMPLSLGDAAANTNSPAVVSTPLARLLSLDSDRVFLTFGMCDASGILTNGYKLQRDSNGYAYLEGTQASPNTGFRTSGAIQLPADATATAPTGTNGRLNWTGALLQWLTLATTYNVILASTALTANRLQKATANGKIANSMITDDGSNVSQSSGNYTLPGQFISTVAIGTPPLVVTSTTNVPNLNASSISGKTMAAPGAIGGTTPAAGTFTTLIAAAVTANTSLTVNGGTALTKIVAYSPNITPAAVGANISAEQDFTVTGLSTADRVFIDNPAPTAGLGIVGVRVKAADTLSITWVNATAGSLTPPAGVYPLLAFRS